MQHHLAILFPIWIELILDGSKTIGCWFNKIRCAPYGKVNKGDIIYMKESGGLVEGMFTVSEVETLDTITSVEVLIVKPIIICTHGALRRGNRVTRFPLRVSRVGHFVECSRIYGLYYNVYANYGQQIFGMRHFSEEWAEFYRSGLLAEALKDWNQSNYATLIHITDPVTFAKPFPFPKRDQRSWVLLDEPLIQTL